MSVSVANRRLYLNITYCNYKNNFFTLFLICPFSGSPRFSKVAPFTSGAQRNVMTGQKYSLI